MLSEKTDGLIVPQRKVKVTNHPGFDFLLNDPCGVDIGIIYNACGISLFELWVASKTNGYSKHIK